MVMGYHTFSEPNLWSRIVPKPEITCNFFLAKNVVSFSLKFFKLFVLHDLISILNKTGRKLLDLKTFKENVNYIIRKKKN